MENINLKFRNLRVNLRQHGIEISDNVFRRFHPATINIGGEICIFCKSKSSLTREHVLPRWLFEKNTESTFISSVNQQTQTYNKTVVPTCSNCNNSLLGELENHIIKILSSIEAEKYGEIEDLYDIIRWLEIIGYKAQVYDCRRKYIKYGRGEYDHSWGIIPLSMMRHFIELNPLKALDYLRKSQRRITVKSKTQRVNSLVIFRTDKPLFFFFYSTK